MPRGNGDYPAGDGPAQGIDCINGIIVWPDGNPLAGRRQGRGSAAQLSPAFGDAALTKLMSLEAEAADVQAFNDMAELMEEAPGA